MFEITVYYFEQIEAKMILIKLIKNYDFELDSTQKLEAVQFTVIRPFHGTRCFITPRQY